jgi:hypothetical protein
MGDVANFTFANIPYPLAISRERKGRQKKAIILFAPTLIIFVRPAMPYLETLTACKSACEEFLADRNLPHRFDESLSAKIEYGIHGIEEPTVSPVTFTVIIASKIPLHL